MIIHEPETQLEDDRVTLISRIEMSDSGLDVPDELFFQYDVAYASWIGSRTDPFLSSLLLVAMQYGEDLHVRGSVSARLLLGLEEYQRTFHCWFPWRFGPVSVRVDREVASEPLREGARACAFSGGIDSFYTLWSHLPATDPNPLSRVSHLLFVHGFDVPLANQRAYETAREAFLPMAKSVDVELIAARTNAQDFAPRFNWGVFHGAPLAGCAQALASGLQRFYVPASHTYNDLVPWGSDPRVDHLLSTESLEVVHDGASATRVAKTTALVGWPAPRGLLRVCSPRADGELRNCCRCEKCLRTMLALEMLGELGHHPTFPLAVERRAVRACRYRNASDFCFAYEMIDYARENRRWDVVLDTAVAVVKSRLLLLARGVKTWCVRLAKRIRS